MGYCSACFPQDFQLTVGKVNSVGIEYVRSDETAFFHKLQRSHAIHVKALILLILCLTEVGVEPDAVPSGQLSAVPHDRGGHAEG